MRAIGYQEIAKHLNGELTLEETREKIIIATRQYAKRQSTWMKRYLRSTN
jgi:tRNA dimethylallyltransferase